MSQVVTDAPAIPKKELGELKLSAGEKRSWSITGREIFVFYSWYCSINPHLSRILEFVTGLSFHLPHDHEEGYHWGGVENLAFMFYISELTSEKNWNLCFSQTNPCMACQAPTPPSHAMVPFEGHYGLDAWSGNETKQTLRKCWV